ncbi:MAG: AI-2E family transporter [Desulfobulbus sp.]|jgi:predicted PurR-regulated permease PerM|nr:AI-2E family transporter [Desulfobulbus sp.]
MRQDLINKSVLLVLVLLISVLFLGMIRQFLMPIFMAGLFSAMLRPAHRWLTAKLDGRNTTASVLIVIGVAVLMLGPLTLLIGVVVGQAIGVSQSVTPWVQAFINEPTTMTTYLEKIPYYNEILPYKNVIVEKAGAAVGNISTFLINGLSSFTKVTVSAVFGTVIMLYVMFYFFTMGEALLHKILYFLPLHDREERRLLQRFTSVTAATMKGTLVIGAMQGTICGLAFAFAGIEGPVFWGTLMAVMSLIPAFGTAIIWLPALLILVLQGEYWGAVILGVLCGVVAGNLDNFLRPRLVGKDTQMHDLFVLFGTLGGISMFGVLGIIIGPIISALFITIWEIYGKVFGAYLPEVQLPFASDEVSLPETETPPVNVEAGQPAATFEADDPAADAP